MRTQLRDARPVFLRVAFANGDVAYLDLTGYCALNTTLLEGATVKLVGGEAHPDRAGVEGPKGQKSEEA